MLKGRWLQLLIRCLSFSIFIGGIYFEVIVVGLPGSIYADKMSFNDINEKVQRCYESYNTC